MICARHDTAARRAPACERERSHRAGLRVALARQRAARGRRDVWRMP